MKCEQCGMTETPDSMRKMVNHVEHCEMTPDPTKVKLVWRNSQVTATLTPEVGETSFAQEFTKHEPEPFVEKTVEAQEEETVPVEEV